ncbi:ATP synthase F1 subunit gamma [Imperialibacter roseus]|uniref:ATP synthase gamma chain n=1 Tax=Imperialibacter roseus TaxID=1324217 RepID=A0ABZ0IN46_9BACT|nr:ATP synthase F1 subunit gamma [Imperialibacter roseus]WOK05937.1 ATP synthase F1 subunit gamma [Imperialibacter roseus]
MANLKEVKGRIQSVTSTQQITKAMKMVAAAKLRRAQDRITQMRPYSEKLTGILRNVTSSVSDDLENEYAVVREVNRVALVVVSSDKGLCGAFNSSVFKAAVNLLKTKYKEQNEFGGVTIIPLGKKAMEFFKKRNYKVDTKYWDIFSNLSFDEVRPVAEYLMEAYKAGDFDAVELVYNEFKNVATQVLRVEKFLPIEPSEVEEESTSSSNAIDYIYEPSKEFIVKELIPKSLKIQVYKATLESNASEQGARMTAMDKATDNAGELLKELKLMYNRTRQAAITKEILEIVGGAEALKSS